MVPESAGDAVRETGRTIFRLIGTESSGVFDRDWWAGKWMDRLSRDPDLKVRMFRFVDVLPVLSDSRQIAGHAVEYLLADAGAAHGLGGSLFAKGAASRPASAVAAYLIKKGIARFSKSFILGETPEAAIPQLLRLWHKGRSFSASLLGEAAVSEAEAERYRDRYLSLASLLFRETAGWLSHDIAQETFFPRVNLSVKISSLYSRIGPANHDESVRAVRRKLTRIFRKVREAGGFVNLDMETYGLKEITLDVFTGVLDDPEFRDWDNAGVALQAYLKCAERDLERLIGWAKERNRRITIRLVKGAYWEYENIVARQKGWEVPVFLRKAHTDWNFERCVEIALAAHEHVTLAVGSHNVRSIAKALVAAEKHGVPRERYEFQMLYGMGEPVKRALKKMGVGVREYAPVGELLPGMAYLVRRLLENASNEGFLWKAFLGNVSRESLLAEPEPFRETPAPPPSAGSGAFFNEPAADFTKPEARGAFRRAFGESGKKGGVVYPAVVDGREHRTGERILSSNPARPRELVGTVCGVDLGLAERAASAARKAQEKWGERAPEERAGVLFRAAANARGRKAELAAWQVREVGKNWVEADADVAEAIDYLEYYGREMLRLGKTVPMGGCPGEENRYRYRPRGVGLVIAPWNFPLAISIGMMSAALVAGNAVLYKPSSLSAVNGWLAFSLLREAGAPAGALQFIPGRGDVVGERLVEHPGIDFIAFTGSRGIGLRIVEKAGRTAPGQRSVKRTVVEMGGKNAIIVDADADLDMAVPAVVQSAFGYQGQKCSACSRVIVHEGCYDRFLERLGEAVTGLTVGPPEEPANAVGPLIDAPAKERVLAYIELGKREGTAFSGAPAPDEGHYVSPTVLTNLPGNSRILREEIFGPVLAVIRAGNVEEAVAAANDSEYALTGGLFSRSPGSIAYVQRTFEAGNLYINRGITGAAVGRQPFGGFKMSGVGSKAGGPDYLLQFLEPRVVTENTMRRGFAPDLIQ